MYLLSVCWIGPAFRNRKPWMESILLVPIPWPPTESGGCLCGATCGSQESSGVSHLGCGALLPGPYRALNHAQKHEDGLVVVFPTVFFDPTEKTGKCYSYSYKFLFLKTYNVFLFQWFFFSPEMKSMGWLWTMSVKNWKDFFLSILHLYAFSVPSGVPVGSILGAGWVTVLAFHW